MAIYDGGVVTTAEIDRAILALPEDERPSGGDLTIDRYRDLVRFLVAERLLVETSTRPGFELDPRSAEELEHAGRQILVRRYIQLNTPKIPQPTGAELRNEYDTTVELYRRETKRLVTHLFKRRNAGDDAETVRSEVEALRRRALAGEKLSLLAREHSDSESRHHDGNLGWIGHGRLPPQLETIIFSLEEGELSEPIVTREGVHLFLVERIVDEKVFEFAEVRETIARRWMEQRSKEATERMANELPPVDGLWIIDPDDLMPLVESGDPQAAVLRNADYEISVARFAQLLIQTPQNEDRKADLAGAAHKLLDDLHRFEKIYTAAKAAGLADDELVVVQLERTETSAIINYARREALESMLAQRPDLTEEYFRNNELRFSSPLSLRLRRLTVPIGEGGASRVMAELERASAPGTGTNNSNQNDLNALADTYGGAVEDIGWKTIEEIAMTNPTVATSVANLRPGSLSPPYQSGTSFVVLEVVERRDPEPRPLATVLDAVHKAYLSDHETELYRMWMDQAIEDANLEIIDDRVATLSNKTTMSGDTEKH